jgi:hypothetical protein
MFRLAINGQLHPKAGEDATIDESTTLTQGHDDPLGGRPPSSTPAPPDPKLSRDKPAGDSGNKPAGNSGDKPADDSGNKPAGDSGDKPAGDSGSSSKSVGHEADLPTSGKGKSTSKPSSVHSTGADSASHKRDKVCQQSSTYPYLLCLFRMTQQSMVQIRGQCQRSPLQRFELSLHVLGRQRHLHPALPFHPGSRHLASEDVTPMMSLPTWAIRASWMTISIVSGGAKGQRHLNKPRF